jgi:hypothetical protein
VPVKNLTGRVGSIIIGQMNWGHVMFALNFYPELYADALMRGRKGATIRLGDKSDKYRSGQILWITVGRRYQVRQKLFTAIIDDVVVKPVGDLDQREVEKENLEFRSPEDVMTLLSRIYDRVVTPLDKVTIISFSPVREEHGSEALEEIFDRWM